MMYFSSFVHYYSKNTYWYIYFKQGSCENKASGYIQVSKRAFLSEKNKTKQKQETSIFVEH